MADIKGTLNQLEVKLNDIFGKQAPQMPTNIKEILVKIAPYLAILGIIFAIPAIFVLIGLGGIATTVAPMGGISAVASLPTMWLSILFLIPSVILQAMAIPGLFSRQAIAWRYMFYSQLIGIAGNILSLNIFGAIIGGLIGFYILFQVKSFYK